MEGRKLCRTCTAWPVSSCFQVLSWKSRAVASLREGEREAAAEVDVWRNNMNERERNLNRWADRERGWKGSGEMKAVVQTHICHPSSQLASAQTPSICPHNLGDRLPENLGVTF